MKSFLRFQVSQPGYPALRKDLITLPFFLCSVLSHYSYEVLINITAVFALMQGQCMAEGRTGLNVREELGVCLFSAGGNMAFVQPGTFIRANNF